MNQLNKDQKRKSNHLRNGLIIGAIMGAIVYFFMNAMTPSMPADMPPDFAPAQMAYGFSKGMKILATVLTFCGATFGGFLISLFIGFLKKNQ